MLSDIKIGVLNQSDYDEVFKFMQSVFRVQEPITIALGIKFVNSEKIFVTLK